MIFSSKKTRKMWLSGSIRISMIHVVYQFWQNTSVSITDRRNCHIKSCVAFMTKCRYTIKTDSLCKQQ